MGRFELEEKLESESESNPLLEVDINNNEVDWEKHFKNEWLPVGRGGGAT